MKFFITFMLVGLLAASCSAQPVDGSAPEQPHASEVLRFKRQAPRPEAIAPNPKYDCPIGTIRFKNRCLSCEKYEILSGKDCPEKSKNSYNDYEYFVY